MNTTTNEETPIPETAWTPSEEALRKAVRAAHSKAYSLRGPASSGLSRLTTDEIDFEAVKAYVVELIESESTPETGDLAILEKFVAEIRYLLARN